VQAENYRLADGAPAFEDGTVSYLSLPAVEIGLRHIAGLGMDSVHNRVGMLTGWLLDNLLALRHRNGAPLVRVYGPTTTQGRGGAITINFYDPQGQLIDYRRVEALANQANISLRTGCFCNPGAGEVAHGLTRAEMTACFQNDDRMTFVQFLTCLHGHEGKSAGAIRVSVGLVTNFADVYSFAQFAAGFVDQPAAEI
jgi:selenocysteine lyase/cysteine desulfurase